MIFLRRTHVIRNGDKVFSRSFLKNVENRFVRNFHVLGDDTVNLNIQTFYFTI
ncbi:hypothetical protein LEP1GSC071_1609 [Leptospira santarosai str. JET]|nr:hypothetical protein LEP1GSC071_1609 [Leptospira santarosai str. JET]